VNTSKYPICKRYEGNPILTGKDFPAEADIKYVFNSGIVKHKGTYIMVCRVENSALLDRFWIAESSDGYNFKPRPKPVDMPHKDPLFKEYSSSMYYDPRVTKIGNSYYILHAAHSGHTCRLSLVKTNDFKKFKWMGFVSETDNRNGVLFPEKINGLYARLDRPNTGDGRGDIWVSYSPDLIYWGKSECVMRNWEGDPLGLDEDRGRSRSYQDTRGLADDFPRGSHPVQGALCISVGCLSFGPEKSGKGQSYC